LDGLGIIYWRFKGFVPNKNPFTVDAIIKWALWFYTEACFYESMDYYRNGVVIVEDLSDFSMKCFDYRFIKNLAEVFQEKFPMNVKRVLLINAPPIFKKLFYFAKFFLKKKISDRFLVLSSNDDICNSIDKDQLHYNFGGNLHFTPEDWIDVIKHNIDYQKTIHNCYE